MMQNFRGGRRTAVFCTGLMGVLLLALGGGCSHSPDKYVSPRVIGRVLNAETHQPIKGVQVKRAPENERYQMEQPKGAQLLERSRGAFTAADGTFTLDSEKDVALFQKFLWYSVTISYSDPDYHRLLKVYTIADSTNAPNGEPIVHAGDILLVPLKK